ncbi:MAG: fructosamine kinase [Halobacteriovoraceae bacterium]|nr:fructosamine kinase [Halobacteriovoraceae bacterium]|tara:strand:+ start:2390 stop:3136 length:747 start_codon:yes stop_codon:yes gene_type:complete
MKTFEKKNPIAFSRSLECEATGLKEIQKFFDKKHALKTPEIISLTQEKLLLEYLESQPAQPEHFIELGFQLANLHRCTTDKFGFFEDNYIGLNPQKNTPCDDWATFFIENRLRFQIEMIQKMSVRDQALSWLSKNEAALRQLLNDHRPEASLVHGDLWSGNYIATVRDVYVIDPAVYYGDREVDIAMSKLFGGFSKDFYEAYHHEYPLDKNFEKRKALYNLYHNLNHYNLFGENYYSSINTVFKQNIS